jgi:hypothetical protein
MANYLRSQGLSYASILDLGSSVINLFRRWAWCQKTCHYQYSILILIILLILLILPGYSYDFLEIPKISYMMSTSKIPDVSSMTRRNNEAHRIPASLAWISRGCHGSFGVTPWLDLLKMEKWWLIMVNNGS